MKTVLMMAVAILVAGSVFGVRAPTPDTTQLRVQLEERYDLVPLTNGVALTPKKGGGTVRLIEVRDGVVSINGDAVSARDLKQRLGADADLVLRVTYLDAAAARALAAPVAAPPAAPRDADRDRDRDGDRDEHRPDSDGRRSQVRRGDIVRFGGSVSVGKDESVDGDVVAIGGSVDIDGEVRGEVTAVGGSANFGPDSHVHGDVTVVGGALNRAPGARIDGKVDEVGMAGGPRNIRFSPSWRTFWSFGSLFATLLRVTLLAMAVLLVTALAPRYVETVGSRAIGDPLRSGLTGLIAEVAFVPLLVITCVVLAISIIGIPLLILVPFAIVLAIIGMVVGFTGVVQQLGRWIAERFGIATGVYGQAMLGLAAVVAVILVARIVGVFSGFGVGFISGVLGFVGIMIEYAAWTVGAGAVILTWYSSRRSKSISGGAPATSATSGPGLTSEVPAQ